MKKFIFILLFSHCISTLFAQSIQEPSKAVLTKVELLEKSNLNLNKAQLSRIQAVLVGEEQNEIRVTKMFQGNKALLAEKLAKLKQHRIANLKGTMNKLQQQQFDEQKLAEKF